MTGRWAGHALVALAAAMWGTWSLFFRPAGRMGPLAPEVCNFASQTAMAVVSGAILLVQARRLRAAHGVSSADVGSATGRPWTAWALMGALGVSDAINGWLYFKAMGLTTLAIAVLTHSIAPLLVAALSPWVTGERAQARTWVCLTGALAGLVLLLQPWSTPAAGVVAGATAGSASAVLYAFNILAQKRLETHFSAPEIVGYHAAVAALVLAALVPAGGWALQAGQLGLVVAAAVVLGAGASLLFLAGMRRIPASHTATLALLEPLVAVTLGVLVWREPLGALGVVGGVLVIGSLVASVVPARAQSTGSTPGSPV